MGADKLLGNTLPLKSQKVQWRKCFNAFGRTLRWQWDTLRHAINQANFVYFFLSSGVFEGDGGWEGDKNFATALVLLSLKEIYLDSCMTLNYGDWRGEIQARRARNYFTPTKDGQISYCHLLQYWSVDFKIRCYLFRKRSRTLFFSTKAASLLHFRAFYLQSPFSQSQVSGNKVCCLISEGKVGKVRRHLSLQKNY